MTNRNKEYGYTDEEDKMLGVLQYFLTLDEADEIFEAIFDKEKGFEEIEDRLDEYRKDWDNDLDEHEPW